ncbi:probable 6-phosphofructo-2-kinase/fructose-2,6-biphosphatase 3 [Rhynchosporium agropyri]|uniref:Probable 6-phosphofructo-2-kinase/fructose-2,6-biphosphatase 3 n=3 Tax=Rhynchosporium TaxID=38037 RepID=A0A1E1MJG2_RHYSE|nr:probable 6-phosphofructo-2-kinase/fructose-2,6-biphosphatase 3 [Rhynchosporium agropyri]CZT09406.1 probable 6-phosphofructo-2-kinase/fructose-2,6-biphosphatase 3 [Rhynchosporium commune]CZT48845.1 probable 6-phosphofructo-2-kinase/fructose-2,6-biphosphatase 3 [Rhynchosporium secalis]
MAANSPLENITTSITLPHPSYNSPSLLAPPTICSLGRALQSLDMNSPTSQNGSSPGVDTPEASNPSTANGSPRLRPVRQNSGTVTPRIRPPATTLNIPGMTRSRVSPDGKIAQRDVGAKLVVIMVGLPARGKSYITKKLHRYLSWQQYDCEIFNVGSRRRTAAGPQSPPQSPEKTSSICRTGSLAEVVDAPTQAAHILLNGHYSGEDPNDLSKLPSADTMEQSAQFFDPKNAKASQLREQVALSTLDELLDFLLNEGGSVGILDATNSTIERRQILFKAIKEREPKLGILFIESVCEDEKLLEANMHLKLKGPDYKDKDPESSLADFKKRVAAYESAYVPLGKFEEDNNMQYIKMIDVGRKVIHFRLQGFLAGGIASYLSTFNLSPRQIWITRHGQSQDNLAGKIGGDSELTDAGRNYATVLYNFVSKKRAEWEIDQKERALTEAALPMQAGDQTPPYPDILGELEEKNFCVWTSMLQRSIQTAECFQDDENYDVKNWEMLKELDAGSFEGMTYEDIQEKFPEQYAKRRADKLSYIYPGVGGEGYLQVISRLRDMVREIERIKDHVLIIGHRSVCRVLMAYFMDLTRDDIADMDVPLGMLFAIEPKPYGIEFHAYKYNPNEYVFEELPNYKPQKAIGHTN